MPGTWTFGRKIGVGLALTALLALLIGAIAVVALRNVVDGKDRVILVNSELLILATELRADTELKSSAARGYFLTADQRSLEEMGEARESFRASLGRLRALIERAEGSTLLDAIDRSETEHQAALDRMIALRRTNAAPATLGEAFERDVVPAKKVLQARVDEFVARQRERLDEARAASTRAAEQARNLVLAIAAAVVGAAGLLAWFLTSSLSRQIGSSVGQVQSSSAELQSAANQQATGAREQATAMSEIASTITELLATSRQISESAQRVASIADQTAKGAQSGELTVEKANEAIAGIRRQTDLIVSNMLELGKKSQQIGSVLDIVSELAEQTNILAINATIEAAGAGEAGKRFAVVAEEIRKLADRVAVSTKEIRTLIDDVRAAVNTTVMTTETGSKAVDAGSRQFTEVAASFRQIARLVATTTEAAREIELSTKQQTTAVEQVNTAIANVSQATRETEASSSQTLQTASQLAGLSRELLRLVQSDAA